MVNFNVRRDIILLIIIFIVCLLKISGRCSRWEDEHENDDKP